MKIINFAKISKYMRMKGKKISLKILVILNGMGQLY